MERRRWESHGTARRTHLQISSTLFLCSFNSHRYSPDIVKEWLALAKACYQPSVVNTRNRELATLGLCSLIKTPYVFYCHRNVAIKLGLTAEQAEAAAAGITPKGLNDEHSMA